MSGSAVTPLRCAWEVVAGLLPGQPDDKHTRSWVLTSDEWHSDQGLPLFLERQALADAYARYLQLICAQGLEVNWTRLDFVWF